MNLERITEISIIIFFVSFALFCLCVAPIGISSVKPLKGVAQNNCEIEEKKIYVMEDSINPGFWNYFFNGISSQKWHSHFFYEDSSGKHKFLSYDFPYMPGGIGSVQKIPHFRIVEEQNSYVFSYVSELNVDIFIKSNPFSKKISLKKEKNSQHDENKNQICWE